MYGSRNNPPRKRIGDGIGIYLYPYSTSELEGVVGKCHSPLALPSGKRHGINYTGGWAELVVVIDEKDKFCPPAGFKPKTIQSVASRYNAYAIQVAEI